jgi:hypothetical protein
MINYIAKSWETLVALLYIETSNKKYLRASETKKRATKTPPGTKQQKWFSLQIYSSTHISKPH